MPRAAYLLANDETGLSKQYLASMVATFSAPPLSGKNIVVVLDAPHVETHWPIGQYRNTFVAQLQQQFGADKLPANIHMLVACSENQHSWASEEYQTTMFAHFFLEGLRGAADKSQRNRISLAELEEYVEAKVSEWVKSNRNAEQKPLLLGDPHCARDVELVLLEEPFKPKPEESLRRPQFSADLAEHWDRWEKLKTSSPWTFAPHLWRRYQEAMLRCEHLERIGDPTRRKGEVLKTANGLEESIRQLRTIEAARSSFGASLPLCRLWATVCCRPCRTRAGSCSRNSGTIPQTPP